MQSKRICPFLIFLIGFIMILTQQLDVFAEPMPKDIVIEAEGGFDGIAKLGAWVPVTIKIISSSRNISGEIEVETNLDQTRKVIISKPINLVAGIEQEIYFEIPVVSAKKGIEIRLIENKKAQAEETYNFRRLLPPDVMLIGVLSEDSEAFNWLNGNTVPVALDSDYDEKIKLMIAAGEMDPRAISTIEVKQDIFQNQEAVVVPLSRESFPDKFEVIEGFDYLIISKYDTSLLNETQVNVLEEWVKTGGTLIAGTGISWQKVYHGLPDSLKPFSITGTQDVQSSETLKNFTGRDAPDMNLKLAKGELGFEFIPINTDAGAGFETQYLIYDNYILAGEQNNPLAIKYRKENGTIVVLTFDPTVEPFASWHSKVTFMENIFKYTSGNIQRFYEFGSGYYQRYGNQKTVIRNLATDVPFDKVPPFSMMFICLGIYVVIVGPVLYIILKAIDKRDLAWVLIPAIAVVFLTGMYLFGFKTRYNTAIINTASLIEIKPESNEAYVSSAIGVFNNRRGTLKIEYDNDNGIQAPFIEQDNNYRSYGSEAEGSVVAKYTMSDPVKFEQYDVMLWTPKMLYAQQIIPFSEDILKEFTIKDGSIKGSIVNTTPYDLLDTIVVIGNNIVRIGDVFSGETMVLNIPFSSKDVYKRPDDYLEAMYGRTYYDTPQEYPDNFVELNQRRRVFENYLEQAFNMNQGRPSLTLLARNEQEIDYGLIVNNNEPKKYNQNLVAMELALSFEPGQEIEIPGGIVLPSMYQEKEIARQRGDNGISILNTGDLEFEFVLPDDLSVNEMRFYVENYIPVNTRYRMSRNSSKMQIELLSNKYEYYLFNLKTKAWEEIKSSTSERYNFDATVKGDMSQYIGSGNEVRMKISVVELAEPVSEEGVYKEYYEEIMTMPDIYLKGVSK